MTIAPDTFKHLSHLTHLRLDGNLLIEFPIWVLRSNPQLQSLTLSSNWWDCQCRFYRKFRMFIDTLGAGKVVKDANQITCNSNSDWRPDHADESNCHSSTGNNLISVKDASLATDEYLLPVILAIVAISVIFIVTLCSFVCIKDRWRICLFSRYGIRIEVGIKKNSNETPWLFDALVLYRSSWSFIFVD